MLAELNERLSSPELSVHEWNMELRHGTWDCVCNMGLVSPSCLISWENASDDERVRDMEYFRRSLGGRLLQPVSWTIYSQGKLKGALTVDRSHQSCALTQHPSTMIGESHHSPIRGERINEAQREEEAVTHMRSPTSLQGEGDHKALTTGSCYDGALTAFVQQNSLRIEVGLGAWAPANVGL